jgi:WD40 repeat protein
VKLWDIESLQEIKEFSGHQKPILVVQALRSTSIIASAGKDKTIKLWDCDTGESFRTLNPGDEVNSILMKNNMLIAGLGSGIVKVFQPTNLLFES